MITLINNTHQVILNNETFVPVRHTAIARSQEAIHKLVEHLKQNNNLLIQDNHRIQISNEIHSSHAGMTHNPPTN